ncbi:unnamed protein product [Nippostrongylus brasiliensis]|uniref:Uncharacterized protein n=1 Tax=Nippostrongylus brasiliensis TaxID=27835 RepID=A0A0N4Y3M3_NIPBR|nr:unnamed protein product [Nippostrongylus brasiliensis]
MATTSTKKKTEPNVVRIAAPAAATTAPQMTDLGGQEPYRGRTPGSHRRAGFGGDEETALREGKADLEGGAGAGRSDRTWEQTRLT